MSRSAPYLFELDAREIDLRSGPVATPLPPRGDVTLRLAFVARPTTRLRVLANVGAYLAGEDGWLIGLDGANLFVQSCVAGRTRGGTATWSTSAPRRGQHGTSRDSVHTVDLHLGDDGGIARAWLDAGEVALEGAFPQPFTVHGEPDRRTGLILGGFTDLAGGHTNVRFGEEPHERIVRLTLEPGHREARRYDRPTPRDTDAAPTTPPSSLVFQRGEGGYTGFRIPGIVRTATGDLIAVAEGRLDSLSDSCRQKHLVLKRSRDDGHSWGPLQVVARHPAAEGGSLMNPSAVVDRLRGTGRIVLVATALDRNEWDVQAGRSTSSLVHVVSDDDGRTWSDLRPLAPPLANPPNLRAAFPDLAGQLPGMQVPSLGHGIQLTAEGPTHGRLLFAGNVTYGASSVFRSLNRAFWSDDLGESWTAGPVVERRDDGRPAVGLNEAAVAELADGSIVLNSRDYLNGRPSGRRASTIGRFNAQGALRWGPARGDPTLVDSGVQASMIRLDRSDGTSGSIVAFCNPSHPTARRDLALRVSDDGGRTWTLVATVHAGTCGYSDLVQLGAGGVGILFERGREGDLAFAAVASVTGRNEQSPSPNMPPDLQTGGAP